MARKQKRIQVHEVAVGTSVFVQTVTFTYTGTMVSLDERWLCLSTAAWIPDTGRFATALQTGDLNEVEPFLPDQTVMINVDTIVALTAWPHPLPAQQK